MSRNAGFLLALAAGILALCLVTSASAVSPSVWHPLDSGFQSLTTGSVVPSQYGGPTARVAATLLPSPTPPKSGPSATPRPTATRAPRTYFGPSVAGIATWFCDPPVSGCTAGYPASGLFAAAGPRLRVGDWRGRYVTVTYRGQHIVVQLVDWCACRGHLIDLYSSAFSRLAPLSAGITEVIVRW